MEVPASPPSKGFNTDAFISQILTACLRPFSLKASCVACTAGEKVTVHACSSSSWIYGIRPPQQPASAAETQRADRLFRLRGVLNAND